MNMGAGTINRIRVGYLPQPTQDPAPPPTLEQDLGLPRSAFVLPDLSPALPDVEVVREAVRNFVNSRVPGAGELQEVTGEERALIFSDPSILSPRSGVYAFCFTRNHLKFYIATATYPGRPRITNVEFYGKLHFITAKALRRIHLTFQSINSGVQSAFRSGVKSLVAGASVALSRLFSPPY